MLIDYYRMYKKYGLKMVYIYIKEAQLYDLIHGVETHRWLQLKDYDIPFNTQLSVLYQSAFTSELQYIYKNIKNILSMYHYDIVDVGSGKGKVLHFFAKNLYRDKIQSNLFGIEFNQKLIDISIKNFSTLKKIKNQ